MGEKQSKLKVSWRNDSDEEKKCKNERDKKTTKLQIENDFKGYGKEDAFLSTQPNQMSWKTWTL